MAAYLLCYRSFAPAGITVLAEVENDLLGRLERARGTYPSAFLARIIDPKEIESSGIFSDLFAPVTKSALQS